MVVIRGRSAGLCFWWASVAVALLLTASGCSATGGSVGPTATTPSSTADSESTVSGSVVVLPAHFTVSPNAALIDEPESVTINGLPPGAAVTVTAAATDASGVLWKSTAQFTATTGGTVSLAQRSNGGDYTGENAMGLFESMQPTTSSVTTFLSDTRGYPATLQASVTGKVLAQNTIERLGSSSAGVVMTKETLSATGIFGDLFMPARVSAGGPAMLVLGGSEGGLASAFLAGTVAAHGYPTLALAYFDEPGLPTTLSQIPLEYFVKALNLLASQPGVDPRKIVVFGVSRGSEAALLLGVHFPGLVHGVIAGSPSAVVFGSYPENGKAAWTLAGKPIPYASDADFVSGDPNPTDAPAAVIGVEQIKGPILTACGTVDSTWQSCRYSAAIMARLSAHHVGYPRTALTYAGAGHYAGSMVCYFSSTSNAGGGTLTSNAIASAQAHAQLLSWLGRL